MDGLKQLVAGLSLRQRVSLCLAALAVIGGLVWLTRWNHERDFRPLYTGLAAEDAGAVVARLREGNIEHRLAENGATVLVSSARIAEIRLQMAAAGLPKTGRIGFELFDKTNFGTTDFAEQVNYHRAVEGELERSVMALSEVERARVHVTFLKDSLFAESRQPAKASVMLQLRPGARLSPPNVTAICHLLASAVEGLEPDAVSVLDMRGSLLNRPRRQDAAADGEHPDGMLEHRQQIERDLLAKINTTLEPLIGPHRFRAGVFVECDFTSGEQSEESFDPARSVMLTAQRTEDVTGVPSSSGVPGTASNLPRPAARPGAGQAGISRRTENISYQSSRVVKRLRLPQGGLKRLSVSLLLDHDVRWEGDGAAARRIVLPPSPERVKAIRDLVAAATGLQPERGDQLIVEALPFESTLSADPAPPRTAPVAAPSDGSRWMEYLERRRDLLLPALIGAAALLALGGLLGYLAFFRRRRAKRASISVQPALPAPQGAASALAGEDIADQMKARISERAVLQQQMDEQLLSSLSAKPPTTKKAEVLSKHIAEVAKKDPGAVAHILRGWLKESEN